MGLRASHQQDLALVAEACCAQGLRAVPGAALVQEASSILGRRDLKLRQRACHEGLAVMTQHENLACLLEPAWALPWVQTASSPAQ